jgi:hypothetical protein
MELKGMLDLNVNRDGKTGREPDDLEKEGFFQGWGYLANYHLKREDVIRR